MEQAYEGLPLERIYVGAGALGVLPGLLAELGVEGSAGLVHVARPEPGLDTLVAEAGGLVGRRLELRHVTPSSGPHGVVLDEATVTGAVEASAGVDVVIAVGSGTISDLAKVVAAEAGVPLVSVQSAASVNGYSNGLSVLMRRGIKRTTPTASPTALLIDPEVLAAAPARLTQAGVGDAVAVCTSPADWYLARAAGFDASFDPAYFAPVQADVADLPTAADGGMDALIRALTVGGLAIAAVHSTAPLSGSEHLMSHVVDMVAAHRHAAHDYHGAQVGAGSVVFAALWRHLLADPAHVSRPEGPRRPSLAELEERSREVWAAVDPSGALGRDCWSVAGAKWRSVLEDPTTVDGLLETWDAHLVALGEAIDDVDRPLAALEAWGAPTSFADLDPALDDDAVRWVLRALPFVRDRFTVVDLLVLTGRWDDELIDHLVAASHASSR
ncbi:MAG: iron-containing alcohol dehydrogenase [Actinomycetota bacterium]